MAPVFTSLAESKFIFQVVLVILVTLVAPDGTKSVDVVAVVDVAAAAMYGGCPIVPGEECP